MKIKMKFQDSNSTPICPFCEKQLNSIERIHPELELTRVIVFTYFCPHCKKVLGFS